MRHMGVYNLLPLQLLDFLKILFISVGIQLLRALLVQCGVIIGHVQ